MDQKNSLNLNLFKIVVSNFIGIIFSFYLKINFIYSYFFTFFFLFSSFFIYVFFLRKNFLKFRIIQEIFCLSYFFFFGISNLSFSSENLEEKDLILSNSNFISKINSINTNEKFKILNCEISKINVKDKLLSINPTKIKILIDINSNLELKENDIIETKIKVFYKEEDELDNFKMNRIVYQDYYFAFAKDNFIKVLGNENYSFFEKNLNQIKNFSKKSLEDNIKDKEVLAIISAFSIGDKEFLSKEKKIKSAYSQTGIIHILAISGLHIGILYFLIQFVAAKLFFFLSNFHPIKEIFSIFLLWIFAFVSGLSPSIQRSATMFSIFSFSKILNKKTTAYDSLFISFFILTLINPIVVFDIGFQLSYLAIGGILFFSKKIENFFKFKNKFFSKIWKLSTVTIAAQIATLPLILNYFKIFPTYFLISNLIVIPLCSIILYLSIFLILFSKISLISIFLSKLLTFILKKLNFLIFFIQNLPFHIIPIKFDNIESILFSFFIFFLFFKKKFEYKLTSLIFFILFFLYEIFQ